MSPSAAPMTAAMSSTQGGTNTVTRREMHEAPVQRATVAAKAAPRKVISMQVAKASTSPAWWLSEHDSPIRKPSTKASITTGMMSDHGSLAPSGCLCASPRRQYENVALLMLWNDCSIPSSSSKWSCTSFTVLRSSDGADMCDCRCASAVLSSLTFVRSAVFSSDAMARGAPVSLPSSRRRQWSSLYITLCSSSSICSESSSSCTASVVGARSMDARSSTSAIAAASSSTWPRMCSLCNTSSSSVASSSMLPSSLSRFPCDSAPSARGPTRPAGRS